MAAPSLPPGAKVVPLHEPSAPAPRTKDTFSRASPALAKLRAQHLLPDTTARAQQRVQALKQLYQQPLCQLKEAQERAMQQVVRRLRLTKSVRNVKIATGRGEKSHSGGSASSVVGALCMPLSTCCALPTTTTSPSTSSFSSSLAVTGAVDGLLTVWDVGACVPVASASSCDGNQWGRVRSLAPYPIANGSQGPLFFSATMFDRRIGVWSLEASSSSGVGGKGGDGSDSHTNTWTLVRRDSATAADVPPTEQAHQHIAGLNRIAVDPTGSFLASTSDDTTLRLWDVRTLSELYTRTSSSSPSSLTPLLPGHLATQDGYEGVGAVLGVAFHPDGSLLSTTDAGGRVVTWDTRTGRHAFTTIEPRRGCGGHLSRSTCVAWSPCGVRLVSGGADSVIQLWDARMLYREEQALASKPSSSSASFPAPFQLLGHEDVVTSLDFYTGAHTVLPTALVSTSLDGTVKLWDMDSGLCVRTLVTGSSVYAQCQPCARGQSRPCGGASSSSSSASFPAALLTVGHAKYWSVWDVLHGDADDADAVGSGEGKGSTFVKETDTLVETAGRVGPVTGASGRAAGGDDDEEDSEEDDEMAALKRHKPEVAAKPPAPAEADGSDDEEDDEMEMLKKKK